MNESPLDKAIREYHESPTDANKERVLLLQAMQTSSFHTCQADSYIRRTR